MPVYVFVFRVHKLLAISVFKDKHTTVISDPLSQACKIFWQAVVPGKTKKCSLSLVVQLQKVAIFS